MNEGSRVLSLWAEPGRYGFCGPLAARPSEGGVELSGPWIDPEEQRVGIVLGLSGWASMVILTAVAVLSPGFPTWVRFVLPAIALVDSSIVWSIPLWRRAKLGSRTEVLKADAVQEVTAGSGGILPPRYVFGWMGMALASSKRVPVSMLISGDRGVTRWVISGDSQEDMELFLSWFGSAQ